jgi:hypothetical protein
MSLQGWFVVPPWPHLFWKVKKLSSDSGNEAAYLLAYISQQLSALSPNGTYIPPTPYPKYSPGLGNSFWLLSLVLRIVSAVSATLMQQGARRYIRLPQIPSQPRDRARVRGFLFLGILKYRMSRTFEAAGVLLHLAVFLFFAGLVTFISTIFKAVGPLPLRHHARAVQSTGRYQRTNDVLNHASQHPKCIRIPHGPTLDTIFKADLTPLRTPVWGTEEHETLDGVRDEQRRLSQLFLHRHCHGGCCVGRQREGSGALAPQ